MRDKSVIDKVTDDFCSAFKTPKDYEGFTSRLVGDGILPVGVNADDERVVEIIKKCRGKGGK